MLDLNAGKLSFPRPKTGVPRLGYLWKETRRALLRVRALKHNRIALQAEGQASLVLITRKGLPYYREREVYADVEVDGKKLRKLKGIAVDNAISITFGRMARELEMTGVTFYRRASARSRTYQFLALALLVSLR